MKRFSTSIALLLTFCAVSGGSYAQDANPILYEPAVIEYKIIHDSSLLSRRQRGETPVETDFGFNLVHMFNHATHHRGQVHAMLTAAGIYPRSTDLPMLPDEA